jgi:hypothetical protein
MPSGCTAVSDIEREEHDKTFGTKKVSLWGYDPTYPGGALRRVTIDSLNYYATNDVDSPDSSTTYEGLMDSDGNWQIVQIVKSGTTISNRYATVKNNITHTLYSDAWTDRSTLTYDYYSVAF